MTKGAILSIEARFGKPLSPAVYAFAVAMQAALDQSENGNSDWKQLSKYDISSTLKGKIESLEQELVKANIVHLNPRKARVTEEAADVANFCLFAALVYGKLLTPKDLA